MMVMPRYFYIISICAKIQAEIEAERSVENGTYLYEAPATDTKQVYAVHLSSASKYFHIQADSDDQSRVQITAKSPLDPDLNETLKIHFTTPSAVCRPMTLYTLTITVEQEVTAFPLNVNVSTCYPGTVIDVETVTCKYLPKCRPAICYVPSISMFWVSEGKIQTKVDNISFSYEYELQVECDEIYNNGTDLPFGAAEIDFKITFYDLCFTDETFEPTPKPGHRITSPVPHPTALETSVRPIAAATSAKLLASALSAKAARQTPTRTAKQMPTLSAWQSKSETIVATTQLPSIVKLNVTFCNSNDSKNVDGILVEPVTAAVVIAVIVIIEVSTAVGCYCLGYKRCLPLLILCAFKDKEEANSRHTDATTA